MTKKKICVQPLGNAFELHQEKSKKRSLRSFFGKMSKRDWKQFQEATAPFGLIDENLWK